jgi:hypothetical protein
VRAFELAAVFEDLVVVPFDGRLVELHDHVHDVGCRCALEVRRGLRVVSTADAGARAEYDATGNYMCDAFH